MSVRNHPFDLTQHPPRSPRQRLGSFVILPRILDKGRAKLAGQLGDYQYGGGLDKRFFEFVQLDPEALLRELSTGKGDGEILAWVLKNAANKPSAWDIVQWSAYQEARPPDTVEAKDRLTRSVEKINRTRADIFTTFDLLDLDDYVSFGGKA